MASAFVMPELLTRRYSDVKRFAAIVSALDLSQCHVMGRMSTIGERVRFLRKARGFSQVELAGLVGISQGSLSLIERNETEVPAGSTVAGLCRALRTTPDFLIAGAGDAYSIEGAMQEHELVFLWRDLPAEARRLVLENAQSVQRAFAKTSDKTNHD